MFFSHHTKIGKISSLIVSFMALAYVLLAVIAVLMNFDKIPSVVHMILQSAFDFKAIFSYRIKRGLFSNEASVGSAPNVVAAALVQEAMREYYGSFGIHFIAIAIVLFTITSLIGNYYAQVNVKYLTNSKFVMNLFRITAVAMIFIGSQMNLKLAWNLADLNYGFHGNDKYYIFNCF